MSGCSCAAVSRRPASSTSVRQHRQAALQGAPAERLWLRPVPAWEIDGRVSIWPHTHEVDPASVLPLATREVRGVEVRVPQVPEDVLTCNFGPGWRQPDPLFKLDWAGPRSGRHLHHRHRSPVRDG